MNVLKFSHSAWHRAVALTGLLAFTMGAHTVALGQVTPADKPLFLSSSVDPNIMFVLDDSGSMHWEITPDEYIWQDFSLFLYKPVAGMYGGGGYTEWVTSVQYNSANFEERTNSRAFRSFALNKSYYNPAVTYRPWARPDGTSFPNAVPTAAFHHPIRTGLGTRNLTVNNTENSRWVYRDQNATNAWWASSGSGWVNVTHYPAVYFRHNGGALWNGDNYTQVNIISTTPTYTGEGRANRTDCTAGVCTYAQEIQNFANWYTYYRSRMLAAEAGIGRAFSTQPEGMRVGFGAINKGVSNVDGVNTRTVIRGVRPFSGTNRTNFFDELYGGTWNPAGTPLRRALDDVGQYFSRSDNRGPWGAVPGTNDSSDHLVCRQSFTILMTDGYWNGDAASTANARNNVDNTAGPSITDAGPPVQSYQYTPGTPFSDSSSDTLADVAMYYWNRDLRPGLANQVPTSNADPAFWQHMVTYGVGLGVAGTVDPDTAFGAIDASPAVSVTWPAPTSSNAAKIDDLLHAGVNSRGGFFSAADPDTFATELSSVLTSIVARVESSGTSAAASSSTLTTDTLVYSASFRSSDWSGNIKARSFDASGNPSVTEWEAELELNAMLPADRKLFTTTEAGLPVPLESGSLGPAQLAALDVNPSGAPASTADAADRVQWLRGTDNAELRSRLVSGVTRRLGDIIGSNPQFVSRTDYGYSLLPGTEGTEYKAFRTTTDYQSRPNFLLAGANDGMYHAFHGTTGKELFAYMPSEFLLPGTSGTHAQINELMRTDYDHRFYVDGASIVTDVYTGGAWRTAAVGTTGAGGRTVFALDVSDPTGFAVSDVMWEFKYDPAVCVADPSGSGGSRACRDIGYGVTNPKVVRLRNGRWAAVFGNGYNSFDHRARLMLVDMETGRLLYNLVVSDNTAAGGNASASNPNGLSPAEATDWPNNNLMLANAYAGDLLGNMWRFDFTGSTPTVNRVFTAVDSAGVRQPITARPRVALKPDSAQDIVVLFGTGSYFQADDDDSTQVQSFYGIFDSATPSASIPTRSDLLEQTITSNASSVTIGSITYEAGDLRYLTQNNLTNQPGWMMDLPASGERIISEGDFPSGAIQKEFRLSTLIPSQDPCASGRDGFIMEVDLASGGKSAQVSWDLNKDGVIDDNDTPPGGPGGPGGPGAPAGTPGGSGEPTTPLNECTGDDCVDKVLCGDGEVCATGASRASPLGRQSWRQLR